MFCVDKCKGRTDCTRVPPTAPLGNVIEIVRNRILIKRSNNVFDDRGTRGLTRPHMVSRKWKVSRPNFYTRRRFRNRFITRNRHWTGIIRTSPSGVRLLDSFAVRDIHDETVYNRIRISNSRRRDRFRPQRALGNHNRWRSAMPVHVWIALVERLTIRKSVVGSVIYR